MSEYKGLSVEPGQTKMEKIYIVLNEIYKFLEIINFNILFLGEDVWVILLELNAP